MFFLLKKLIKKKFLLGNFYRYIILKYNINLFVKKKYKSYFILLHCYFFFFNFKNWAESPKNKNFKLLMKSIKYKKCFLDIGAHAGFFTLPASKVNKKIDIHCFEPSQNFFLLKKNIEMNNLTNVKINKLVVFNKNGQFDFGEENLPSPVGSILLKKNMLKLPTITIDSYVQKYNILPDIIKIDTEGSELEVLMGAKRTLLKFSPDIFLSYHPKIFLSKYSKFKLLSFIKEIKYNIYDTESGFQNDSFDKKTEIVLKKNIKNKI